MSLASFAPNENGATSPVGIAYHRLQPKHVRWDYKHGSRCKFDLANAYRICTQLGPQEMAMIKDTCCAQGHMQTMPFVLHSDFALLHHMVMCCFPERVAGREEGKAREGSEEAARLYGGAVPGGAA